MIGEAQAPAYKDPLARSDTRSYAPRTCWARAAGGYAADEGEEIGGAATRRARRRLAPSLSLSSGGGAAATGEIKGRAAP